MKTPVNPYAPQKMSFRSWVQWNPNGGTFHFLKASGKQNNERIQNEWVQFQATYSFVFKQQTSKARKMALKLDGFDINFFRIWA